MKYLYKYPQAEFPYGRLLEENLRRGRRSPEFELIDTGVFAENRYFDVTVEYAKAGVEDILARISMTNHGPERAEINVLPTIWFRNTWSWGTGEKRPVLRRAPNIIPTVELEHAELGRRWLVCEGSPDLLFTENETNFERVFGTPNESPYVKDGIGDCVVDGRREAVNPNQIGTKAAAHYSLSLNSGETETIRLRFFRFPAHGEDVQGAVFGPAFESIFTERKREADEFYESVIPPSLSADAKNVMRQAFAGLLWSKQFYHYVVRDWLNGDPAYPPPPPERRAGRNAEWLHLYNADVISMPDKWEYPWYAAWDLAFHAVAIALVDAEFAKQQLVLMLREWYMHPNGQLPAYEWALGDVNPPMHAWAAWRVYKIEKKRRGVGDCDFLKRIFQKLCLNFTWWVNRKDSAGRNVFQGGFLGLDNIGVFDRSAPLPTGGYLEQADATGWMAMYCLNLLAIAMELADVDPTYEDVASKFWEHFLYIADAINHLGSDGVGMWDEEDGFYYDVQRLPNDGHIPLRIRSMVGLIPLFAVETLEARAVNKLTGFKRRMEWFIEYRKDLTANVACMETPGEGERRLLSLVTEDQLRRVLAYVLDENEFLAPHGIRSLSRVHRELPYVLRANGSEYRVDYEPGESATGLFGGNSNWRGPIWFPVNYLLIESLQKFHHYLGDDFQVECPAGSGRMMNLWDVAAELSRRMTRIFLRDEDGARPVHGGNPLFRDDPHWRDLILFYEYFHGENGAGLGASHQTGWTALIAKVLQQSGEPVAEESPAKLIHC
ncbi:MAG: glucosidase [Acidobacteriia bacterium]|nr:glucosidase [Terriglobia bacterium]